MAEYLAIDSCLFPSERLHHVPQDDFGTGDDLMSKVKGTAPHVWVEKDCQLVAELGRADLKRRSLL